LGRHTFAVQREFILMSTQASEVVEKVSKMVGPLEPKIEPIRQGAEELDSRVRDLVRRHPGMTLFGALCLGYSVGRIIAKR
jgi:hypothetical protein